MPNQTIVIVGASRGIGAELVKLLAKEDSNKILALSRDKAKMDALFGDLKNVDTFAFDLNSSVREQAEYVFSSTEKIDILINNAGLLKNKPFTQLTHEDISSCYQVNVIGVMETVQAAVGKMQNSGGHIVNISSMGGFQGSVKFPGLSAYSTSKAAVCSFTELFAEEYKESKIRMNCLCLGAAQTEMLEEAFPGYQANTSATDMASYIANFALTGNQFYNGKVLQVSSSTP